jgi:hypothetical protein
MALHCAATLLIVPAGVPTEGVGGPGAVLVDPLHTPVDVVDALQALADLHRGERVVVPMGADHVAAVLERLGRGPVADGEVVRLEIGDDGWAVLPGVG